MLNHRDVYYKHYYSPEKLSYGIELVAKIEQLTKKDTATMLMERGLSSYMGEKLTEHIQNEKLARGKSALTPKTRFIQIIRHYANEKGLKIKDILKKHP